MNGVAGGTGINQNAGRVPARAEPGMNEPILQPQGILIVFPLVSHSSIVQGEGMSDKLPFLNGNDRIEYPHIDRLQCNADDARRILIGHQHLPVQRFRIDCVSGFQRRQCLTDVFFFQIFVAGHFYTAQNIFLYNHRQQPIIVGRAGNDNAHQGIASLFIAGKYRILDTFQIADRFAGTEILLNRLLQRFFGEQKVAANLDLRNLVRFVGGCDDRQ